MINLYKKIGVSIILAGAFGVSANAVCLSENYCTDFYLGVGGFLEKINGSGANINDAGGFVSLGGSDVFSNRVQIGLDIKLGYGNNSVGGNSLNSINKSNSLFQFDGIGKIGVNVAGINSPLFVNFLAGYDFINSKHGVGRELYIIGVGVDGKVRLNENNKLTYSVGYGYVFNGVYSFNNVYSAINEGSKIIMFSLGTQTKISENVSFYTKGFGKYYGLNASTPVNLKNNGSNNINMPNSSGWQAGLEAGVIF